MLLSVMKASTSSLVAGSTLTILGTDMRRHGYCLRDQTCSFWYTVLRGLLRGSVILAHSQVGQNMWLWLQPGFRPVLPALWGLEETKLPGLQYPAGINSVDSEALEPPLHQLKKGTPRFHAWSSLCQLKLPFLEYKSCSDIPICHIDG
jgi:hypothetical protein